MPATQNDMTTSSDTSTKTRFCDFSHRHGNFSLTTVLHLTHMECHKVPRLPRKTPLPHLLTRRKRHVFCHFSHRHGNFSFTTVLHLTHMECHKVPRLPRKTPLPHLLTRRKRHVFATFPIGKATSASRQSCTSHTWNATKCHACHAKRHDQIF